VGTALHRVAKLFEGIEAATPVDQPKLAVGRHGDGGLLYPVVIDVRDQRVELLLRQRWK